MTTAPNDGSAAPRRPAPASSPAAAVLDGAGDVIGWSRAAEALLGYPEGEILDRPADALLAGGDRVPRPEHGDWSGVARVRHRAGHDLRLGLRVGALGGAAGREHWLMTMFDLDEAVLPGVNRSLLDGLLAHLPIGMAVMDTELRYTWVNDALVRASGVSDRLGRTLGAVFPSEQAAAGEVAMRRVLETGTPCIDYEYRGPILSDPSGEHMYAASFFRLEDEDNRPTGLCYLVLDVTERWRRHHRELMLGRARACGKQLDPVRAAQELAEICVPDFADLVSVELADAVIEGGEIPAVSGSEPVRLRRAAHLAAGEACVSFPGSANGAVEYGPCSRAVRCLTDGEGTLGAPADVHPDAWAAARGHPGTTSVGDPRGTGPVRTAAAGTDADDREHAGTAGPESAGTAGGDADVREHAGTAGGDADVREHAGTAGTDADSPEHAGTAGTDADVREHAGTAGTDAVGREHAGTAGTDADSPEHAGTADEDAYHPPITVPLCAGAASLGLVTFRRRRDRDPFTPEDLAFAEEFAVHGSAALAAAHRFAQERRISLSLQRSLLPGRLGGDEAAEIAWRYFPASQEAGVGGDWVDVIPLSGARVALVVGDVVGHGVGAAAAMGRLRAAVHTLAAMDLPPDELLAHLDDFVTRIRAEQPCGTDGAGLLGTLGASCMYAVYDPVDRTCTLARAAHPAPVIVRPDGTAFVPDLPAGSPLGIGSVPFEAVEMDCPDGSLVAFFTDGLVEDRHKDMEEGVARLCALLGDPGAPLERLCDDAVDALLSRPLDDDAALLLARTTSFPDSDVAVWEIPGDPAAVREARALANRQLDAWGLEDLRFATELIVSELVTNAIRYGTAPIRLRLIRHHVLTCEVLDGSSTSPRLRHARTTDEGGRGLFLVAQASRRWGYRYTGSGKSIWVEQELP
ncbi:SpoIIE family protein phosphatase [Streptomyces sp. NPDC094468]|uniref:SpoIIE family protein phosphatase n=1 Tax=Streptomyces sp. NPDC094468 TaxID=3366066 RepID=UPI003817B273